MIILGICLNDTENWHKPHTISSWRKDFVPQPPKEPYKTIIRHSRILNWIYMKKENLRTGSGFVKYYRRLYDPKYSGYERFVESIHLMKTKCDTNRTTLIAAVLPLLSCNLDEKKYPFEFAHSRIHNVLESENIPYIDLLKYFRGTQPDRLQVIPGVDPHPDELAHQIIAEGMVNYLLEKGLIDSKYKPALGDNVIHSVWQGVAEKMYHPLDRKDTR